MDSHGIDLPESSFAKARSRKNEEWDSCNLLSLDGGGIRGYWSLLAIRQLMEYIADKETELNDSEDVPILHSFSPEALPDNVSHFPLSAEEERKGVDNATTLTDKCRAMIKARRFLPCHYFDHICGSSTGALIAILLGRLRMTVQDCIEEYKNLGEEVFGAPRFFCTLNFGLGDRARYSATRLRKVFESVSARRNEYLAETDGSIAFPSGRGMCKTFVTTLRTESHERSAKLYLIRSYDHNPRVSPETSKAPTRATTMSTNRTNTGTTTGLSQSAAGVNCQPKRRSRHNHGHAQNFEIWQVARAATAAKWFFNPLKIEIPGSARHLLFKDGGFGPVNNPTKEAKHELEALYGKEAIGIIVSVGTARKDEHPKPSFVNAIPGATRAFASAMSNPEGVHEGMESEVEREESYFRINDPGALGIDLDEWKPRKTRGKTFSGSKTLSDIDHAFNAWMRNPEIQTYLMKCAELLVRCRQSRMHTTRWPRFATGTRYVCRAKKCEQTDFLDRESFAEHLTNEHPERPNAKGEEEDACRRYWRYPQPPKS